jgi:hypothetical protein
MLERMRPGPRLFALAAALAVLGRAGAALAEPERTSSLGWVRLPSAESCLGPRALAEAVERRLRRHVVVSAAQADVTVEGWVERSADGWHAVIRLADAHGAPLGTRELTREGASCSSLDDDLVLAIALRIDPAAVLGPAPPPAPPPPLLPAPPPRVLVQTVLVPVAPPAPPAPWRTSLEVGPVLALGLLPGIGGGLALRGLVTPPRLFAFEVGGTVYLPDDASAGASGARFTLASGFISACPIAGAAGGTRVLACAGVEVGALRVGGFGFDLSETNERPVVNAAVRGRVRQRLVGPLAASLGAAVLVPFVRDTFFFGDLKGAEREVFRMAPVGAAVDLSLGVEFP